MPRETPIDAQERFERRHALLIEELREGGHHPMVAVTSAVAEDGLVDHEPVLLCPECGEIREMWPWHLFRGLRPGTPCPAVHD